MAYNRWLSSNYLEHHGVKGQQWGVTNGPPYPLDRSKSDGHKLIKGDGSPQGKKKYTSSQKTAYKRAQKARRPNEWNNGRPLTEKVRNRTADDLKAIEEAQKYDDQQHRRILNGANFLANTKLLAFKISRYGSDSANGLPVKKKETSKDYDLKTINPGGKSTTLSGANNCLLCTVAYDMRRRGYNVIARQRAPIEFLYDIGDEDLSNMYKNTKAIRDDSLSGITNKIKRQKNSRGSISCTWNGSKSGHVVAYEVNNGRVTLYDAQSGIRYDDPSVLFSDAHNFRAVRLDNATPNYRLIKLAVE